MIKLLPWQRIVLLLSAIVSFSIFRPSFANSTCDPFILAKLSEGQFSSILPQRILRDPHLLLPLMKDMNWKEANIYNYQALVNLPEQLLLWIKSIKPLREMELFDLYSGYYKKHGGDTPEKRIQTWKEHWDHLERKLKNAESNRQLSYFDFLKYYLVAADLWTTHPLEKENEHYAEEIIRNWNTSKTPPLLVIAPDPVKRRTLIELAFRGAGTIQLISDRKNADGLSSNPGGFLHHDRGHYNRCRNNNSIQRSLRPPYAKLEEKDYEGELIYRAHFSDRLFKALDQESPKLVTNVEAVLFEILHEQEGPLEPIPVLVNRGKYSQEGKYVRDLVTSQTGLKRKDVDAAFNWLKKYVNRN